MEVLEPRKANDPTDPWNSDIAVYASSEPVYSIIFAVKGEGFKWSTSNKTEENGKVKSFNAQISESQKQSIENAAGYVYILPRATAFEQKGERLLDFKSREAIRPVTVVEVRLQDYYDMGGQVEWIKTPEKPSVLYHASPYRDIEEFEPRAHSVRDPEEGPVVFATPSEAYASMFLIRIDDRWSEKGRFNSIYYAVINDRQRFEEMDKGGSIYVLPSDTFETDENKSMGSTEWTSKEPVKPLRKKDYDPGLEAMLQHGVQVYFVDTDTWLKIKDSDDHGFSILLKQQSENAKRGINYIPLDR